MPNIPLPNVPQPALPAGAHSPARSGGAQPQDDHFQQTLSQQIKRQDDSRCANDRSTDDRPAEAQSKNTRTTRGGEGHAPHKAAHAAMLRKLRDTRETTETPLHAAVPSDKEERHVPQDDDTLAPAAQALLAQLPVPERPAVDVAPAPVVPPVTTSNTATPPQDDKAMVAVNDDTARAEPARATPQAATSAVASPAIPAADLPDRQLPEAPRMPMENTPATTSATPLAAPEVPTSPTTPAVTATAAAAPVAQHAILPPPGKDGWNQAIGQRVMWMVGTGQHSATLSLNPPDLGPLHIVIHVHNDRADASFFSDRQEVRQALQDGMDNLRDMMKESGINLGQASIDQRDQAPSQFTPPNGAAGTRADDDATTLPEAVRPGVVRVTQGLIDTFA